MTNDSAVSIIVPVRNEPENIVVMIHVLEATVTFPHETLIVYDDLQDSTIQVASKLANQYDSIKLVHNTLGRGAKNATIAGVKSAKHDILAICIADEVIPIIALGKMWSLISKGSCDFVSGTRYAAGGRRYGGSFVGSMLSRVANKAFRLITRSALTDLSTGYKMFRRTVWNQVNLDSSPVGWAFAFELAIKAEHLDSKVAEVPIISVDRLFGGSSTFHLLPWVKEYLRWFIWGIRAKSVKRKAVKQ
jgi:dolichol-phosphate mannosyltransferase